MLSKKDKMEVASAINSLVVANMMLEAKDLEPKAKHNWLLRRCRVELGLRDRFGIVLPGLEHAEAIVRMDLARLNAD